jgi:hypothetical protein
MQTTYRLTFFLNDKVITFVPDESAFRCILMEMDKASPRKHIKTDTRIHICSSCLEPKDCNKTLQYLQKQIP